MYYVGGEAFGGPVRIVCDATTMVYSVMTQERRFTATTFAMTTRRGFCRLPSVLARELRFRTLPTPAVRARTANAHRTRTCTGEIPYRTNAYRTLTRTGGILTRKSEEHAYEQPIHLMTIDDSTLLLLERLRSFFTEAW